MQDLKLKALFALQIKYEADISLSSYNIANYLQNPTAIGEHPHLLDELDKFIDQKANAMDKLAIVKEYLEQE